MSARLIGLAEPCLSAPGTRLGTTTPPPSRAAHAMAGRARQTKLDRATNFQSRFEKEAAMATTRRTARCTVFVGLLAQVLCWVPSVAAQDPEAVSAKTWVGREA